MRDTSDKPLSEQFRIIAKRWVEQDGAARLMEEMKTTVLEQRKTNYVEKHGDMSDAKVERIIKADKDWSEYIVKMVSARTKANMLRQHLEYIRMQHSEWVSANANARKEMGL